MKRFLASALIIGVSTCGLVGCEEKTEVKKVETVKTPDGTRTTTDRQTTEATGNEKSTAPTTGTPR